MFNLLCEQSLKIHMDAGHTHQERILNWHRLNMAVGYSHFEQKFYILPEEVDALASASREDVTARVLHRLIVCATEQRQLSSRRSSQSAIPNQRKIKDETSRERQKVGKMSFAQPIR